jgi:phosphoadenosine phosphosulfate reductase
LEHNYEAIIPYENALTEETYGYCDRKDMFVINPLAEWPVEYIWDYSQEAHLEQCCLYQEGFHRLGCIGCPMARSDGRKREFIRWPKFEAQYKRTFQTMFDRRKERWLQCLRQAATPEGWFEWWLSDKSMEADEEDEDQLMLEGLNRRT